ncbi:uncharacterized protein LOC130731997 [Lotus japonicus]|uniref:uncharacterized protein LOC130731997 n=1 Tax=Lotus japonicus TaxID=34305 RepID=UPI0025845EA3|nr:uncharacterized protein LOC130731997 [Lotus japonicus]
MAAYSTGTELGFPFPNLDPALLNCSIVPQQPTQIADKVMDISPLEGLFELDWDLRYQSNHLAFNDFDDLENFSRYFNQQLPPLDEDFEVHEQKSLKVVLPVHCGGGGSGGEAIGIEFGAGVTVKKEMEEEEKVEKMPPLALTLPSSSSSRVSVKKSCSRKLEFAEIKKHFGVKISEAAKNMNVGLTFLKRRCRELKIMRWPHRKLKSLNSLIDNVKELGFENELAKLEKQRRMLEREPGMELNLETMKLRQACFKANYKRRRRCLTIQA